MIGKRKPITEEAARLKLADLCARSEQCEYDLRTKMRRWQLPASEIESVLAFLRKGKFVDDARYAGAFARDKARFAKWGRRKIAVALAAKRISSAHIREALDGIDEDEYREALSDVARSKARSLDLTDPKDRQKLYTSLLARGYESSLIAKILQTLSQEP